LLVWSMNLIINPMRMRNSHIRRKGREGPVSVLCPFHRSWMWCKSCSMIPTTFTSNTRLHISSFTCTMSHVAFTSQERSQILLPVQTFLDSRLGVHSSIWGYSSDGLVSKVVLFTASWNESLTNRVRRLLILDGCRHTSPLYAPKSFVQEGPLNKRTPMQLLCDSK
jgi:hypothetical protein